MKNQFKMTCILIIILSTYETYHLLEVLIMEFDLLKYFPDEPQSKLSRTVTIKRT